MTEKENKQNEPKVIELQDMLDRIAPDSGYYNKRSGHLLADILNVAVKAFQRPRFALFLGAGASIESGIPSANEMIDDFVARICTVKCPNFSEREKQEKWLVDNKYYEGVRDKYSALFEKCFPKAVDRREYIEEQVDGKVPSWGYIALAHLLETHIFDTVITTNFDDLVYIACTSFVSTRPVVFSLGGFASEISSTFFRPRVLKMHGDYLFSHIKNIKSEIEQEEVNMVAQIQQILDTYKGLIVSGYSGNDDSVINILKKIPDGKYLFWCVYKDEEINEQVRKLLIEKDGWIVRTDGFDKLMDEIRKISNVTDDSIFSLFEKRRKRLEEEVKKFNPKDFQTFSNAHEAFAKAMALHEKGELVEAEKLYRDVIKLNPSSGAHHLFGWLLHQQGKFDEALEEYKKSLEFDNQNAEVLVLLALANKHLGNKAESISYAEKASKLVKEWEPYTKAYLASFYEKKDEAIDALTKVAQSSGLEIWMMQDPELDWLQDDLRFKEIMKEVKLKFEAKQKEQNK